MFDKERFQFALENYKKDFPTWWQDEKYKWEAVKCFQDNWNISTNNFEGMLRRALSKTYNLLSSTNYFPALMITEFAKRIPEKTRAMFIELFDESQNLYERIENFKNNSDILLKEYLDDSQSKYRKSATKHHQDERAMSVYLWLRYPEKYYIYKFTEAKNASDFLKSSYVFKKGAYAENIKNFFLFYDEICAELENEDEIVAMLRDEENRLFYSDLELHTLTGDFVFYITQNYHHLVDNFNLKKNIDEEKFSEDKPEKIFEPYYPENFLSEVFVSAEKYQTLVEVLKRKKNIILQGAPGVGKTFAAKRLAYSIIGAKDDGKIEFVQFHQNYSYEDFVMGWRPSENNFKLRTGIFYNFCKKAATEPDKKFFFIIDEINRGNLSKIFGELLMAIESDKRGKENVKLAYNGEIFSVPENLYIIGMMNTADRSLALIDYALRRRFSFFEMIPAFDSDGFKNYQSTLNNKIFDKLIEQIKILNAEISADKTLGKGFCIGHSYFCNCKVEDLRSIVDYEILPLLEEYYFDYAEKVRRWEKILRSVFDE